MPQPDWDHKHPGDYPPYTESQHGPSMHTHGANGKVDTILGESTNPTDEAERSQQEADHIQEVKEDREMMGARCGLEDCDCSYVIDRLVQKLERIEDMTLDYLGTSQAAGDIAQIARDAIHLAEEDR